MKLKWRELDDIFATPTILQRIYEKLPLDGVETDYEGEILRQGNDIQMRYSNGSKQTFHTSQKMDTGIVVPKCKISFDPGPDGYRLWRNKIDEIAKTIVERLLSTHPGRWEAFACQCFADNHKIFLIYMVKINQDSSGQPSPPPASACT